MNLFGYRGSRDEDEEGRVDPYASLNEKVDCILQALHIHLRENDSDLLPPEVMAYVARGQKIQAIKVYRERTGVSLLEAKEAVDGTGSLAPLLVLERKIDLILENLGLREEETVSEEPRETRTTFHNSHVEDLLRRGDMISAIREYREQNECGLKEAKDAVDEIQQALRSRTGR